MTMTYLTTTSTFLVAAITLLTTVPFLSVAAEQGFGAAGTLNLDLKLTGNTNVIGAHLHTGSANTNGPVAVIFCGVAPLPSMNGACGITSDTDYAVNNEESARYVAKWVSNTVDPNLAFTSGVNANTAVSGATSIADGAASSLEELGTELRACTDASTCNVYINIHTNYSDTQNPGLGLARGQLQLVPCLDKDGIDPQFFKCFSASVTSANTNAVPVPNQLPENAGTLIPPLNVGDVLIVWYDPEDTGTGTCAPDSEQCGEYSVARVIQNGNTAKGGFCSVGGGANNSAGKFETSLRDYAVVGGGDTNNAAAQKSVISGGANNRIILFDSLPFEANQYCVISGGQDHNPITGTDNPEYRTTGSVITGGKENFFANPQVPPNNHMTISGGSKISTGGKQSVVTGGKNSLSLGIQSVILGGTLHTITATGDYSAIPGGRLNMAEGTASIAMGQSATALHDHSMVINLQGNTEFTESTDPGQFLVQAKEYKFQVTNDPGPNDENVLFLDANNIQYLQDAIDNLPARRRELSPEIQATEDKISARRIKEEHDRERRHRKVQAIRKRHGLN